MTAARDYLRNVAPDAAIEVYTRNHGVVYLEVRWPDQVMRREYELV